MGIVRRHPILTLIFVVGSLPVILIVVVMAAQHTPACSAWRAQVDYRAEFRKAPSASVDFHRGEMPVDEYFGGVRDHVAWEMRDSRPFLCR